MSACKINEIVGPNLGESHCNYIVYTKGILSTVYKILRVTATISVVGYYPLKFENVKQRQGNTCMVVVMDSKHQTLKMKGCLYE